MSPFEPIGERARWRIICDLLRDIPTDGVLTYEQIAKALELEPEADRHTIQMAVRRAAREHLETDLRSLDVIPNEGYRIVPAHEKLRLARGQQKKADKSIERGSAHVVNVDLSGLPPEQRNAFEVVARAFALQMEFNKRFDIRQKRLEDSVNAMTKRTDRTEEEIAELRARLARLEDGG